MDFPSRLLVFVLMSNAVSGSSVQYVNMSCVHENICALLESQVTLTCSHSNISFHTRFWYSSKHKAKWRNEDDPEDLALDSDYAGRVSYAEMNNVTINLTITDLRERDAAEYRLVLVTVDGQKYVSSTGVTLELTDLQVAKDSMNQDLYCRMSCPLNPKKIFWYENGQYLKDHGENHLSLSKIKNASYSCSVGGYNRILSPPACYSEDCWEVTYTNRRVCALLGSSVEFAGSYVHPRDHTVKNVFWVSDHQKYSEKDLEDLRKNNQFSTRVEYGLTLKGLTLNRLIMRDSGEYRLRFITDKNTAFSGRPGVILNVTDLLVRSLVASGDAVTLTCSTSCTLPGDPTYIWYKNDQPVNHLPAKYNKLYLKRSTDAGNYSCTIKGRDDLHSPAQTVEPCLRNPDLDLSRKYKYAAVGAGVVLAVILITGALCIRARRSRSATEHSVTEVKEAHAVQDEVQYSSLHFLPSGTNRAPPSRCANSPRDSTNEEASQYAVVNFKR